MRRLQGYRELPEASSFTPKQMSPPFSNRGRLGGRHGNHGAGSSLDQFAYSFTVLFSIALASRRNYISLKSPSWLLQALPTGSFGPERRREEVSFLTSSGGLFGGERRKGPWAPCLPGEPLRRKSSGRPQQPTRGAAVARAADPCASGSG